MMNGMNATRGVVFKRVDVDLERLAEARNAAHQHAERDAGDDRQRVAGDEHLRLLTVAVSSWPRAHHRR